MSKPDKKTLEEIREEKKKKAIQGNIITKPNEKDTNTGKPKG